MSFHVRTSIDFDKDSWNNTSFSSSSITESAGDRPDSNENNESNWWLIPFTVPINDCSNWEAIQFCVAPVIFL
jgi:hypothetical protein